MLGYILVLILVVGIQFALQYILGGLGLPLITVELIVNFVIALVFAFFNYRGNKKEAIKDIRYHRSVLSYFLVFTIISFIIMGVNYLLW